MIISNSDIDDDDIIVFKTMNFEEFPAGEISHGSLEITSDAFGSALSIPILIAKGLEKGPVLGLTSTIHGNELNGILVIQQLFRNIDPLRLKGIIIAIPVVNIWWFLLNQRKFIDGFDLNQIMPGKAKGNQSSVFVYRFIKQVIHKLDYLIDLHTASFGRINSHYVRVNMQHEKPA